MTFADSAMNIHHKDTKARSNSIAVSNLIRFVFSCLGGKSLFPSWEDRKSV